MKSNIAKTVIESWKYDKSFDLDLLLKIVSESKTFGNKFHDRTWEIGVSSGLSLAIAKAIKESQKTDKIRGSMTRAERVDEYCRLNRIRIR